MLVGQPLAFSTHKCCCCRWCLNQPTLTINAHLPICAIWPHAFLSAAAARPTGRRPSTAHTRGQTVRQTAGSNLCKARSAGICQACNPGPARRRCSPSSLVSFGLPPPPPPPPCRRPVDRTSGAVQKEMTRPHFHSILVPPPVCPSLSIFLLALVLPFGTCQRSAHTEPRGRKKKKKKEATHRSKLLGSGSASRRPCCQLSNLRHCSFPKAACIRSTRMRSDTQRQIIKSSDESNKRHRCPDKQHTTTKKQRKEQNQTPGAVGQGRNRIIR